MSDCRPAEPVAVRDRAVIAFQLGRRPRDLTGVAVRCPFGRPVVIETAPVLSDGTPNPTLFYLTCPVLAVAISRIEAGGGVRTFKSCCEDDPVLAGVLGSITRLYRDRRIHLLGSSGGGNARLEAGIGGPPAPEKASCLHAYAAAILAARFGWLSAAGEEGARLAEQAEQVWARFYPPLEDLWCRDDRCGVATVAERRAVVDVGTISVRLLVADVEGDRMEEIERRTAITRLGEGLRPEARLRAEAAERTAATVAGFVEEARRLGALAILVGGTSAVREAADGRDFLTSLGRRLGVGSLVLSSREEAELGYAGAALDVAGNPTVIDLGGGSTEVSRGAGIRFEAVSLAIGAAKATERWITTDPPADAELERVRMEAERMFAPLIPVFGRRAPAGVGGAVQGSGAVEGVRTAERVGAAGEAHSAAGADPDGNGSPLVGVAGTVTTLACLAAGLERYDRAAIHLRSLSSEEIRARLERLKTMTTPERAALACVQEGRAPLIVAGAVIILAAMDVLGFTRLTVSERDLLDGLILRRPW